MSRCTTCPFDGGDNVEQAINLGCVPSVYEIVADKRENNRNWGCHSAVPGEVRPCAGFVRACHELRLDHSTGPHLSYHEWYHGPDNVPTT